MSQLNDDERIALEEAIFDCSTAAEKYLTTGKEVHMKMLQVSVSEALEYLEVLQESIQEDEKMENYKLHLMVPLQIVKHLELKND